jgi:hypothetical protein
MRISRGEPTRQRKEGAVEERVDGQNMSGFDLLFGSPSKAER